MRRFDFRSPNDSYSWLSLRSSGVPEHTHSFDRDEGTSSNHLVEDRKQPIDMCLVIDNLDHNRQIRGQLDQTGSVDDAHSVKTGGVLLTCTVVPGGEKVNCCRTISRTPSLVRSA